MLVESIDETIVALFSRKVVDALFLHLQTVHSITKNEVPYRLETLFSTLERTFGLSSSKIICKAIARRLHVKLALAFFDNPGRTFLEYVEEAKIKLEDSKIQL